MWNIQVRKCVCNGLSNQYNLHNWIRVGAEICVQFSCRCGYDQILHILFDNLKRCLSGPINVWCIKNRTILSNVLLLCLVRILMHQTLFAKLYPKEIDYLSVSNKENQLLHKETIKPDMLRLLKFNSPRSKREEWTLSSKCTSCLEFI